MDECDDANNIGVRRSLLSTSRWKKIVWVLIILILLCSIIGGMNDGIRGLKEARSVCEKIVELLSISYGVAGILALMAWRLRPSWFFFTLFVWAILVEACGTLAATVYAEEARWIAGISAGMSVAAIFIPILIFVRRQTRKGI